MRHDEHRYCEDHRPPGMRGVVYQNFWMRKHGIRPVPVWLVGWFVIPLEQFRAWRQRRRDAEWLSLSDEERAKRDADIPF